MNFHDISLPKFMQVFATGQPSFLTSVVTTASGQELRKLDRNDAIQKYIIKNCFLSNKEFEEFNSFFRARRGQTFAFKFFDYADHSVVGQTITTSDSLKQEFQLFKLYKDSVLPYFRKITKPIRDSVTIYVNNNKVAFEIDYDKGIITLKTPLSIEDVVSADFMFEVVVRFCSDSFEYNYCSNGAIELSNIELIEVRI